MAVLSCTYAFDPSASYQASVDDRGRGTYNLHWDIVTNAMHAQSAVIVGGQATGPNALPSRWAQYSFQGASDLYSFAREFSVHLKNAGKTRYVWRADVTYKPLTPGEFTGFDSINPLLRPTIWSGDVELLPRVLEFDKDGKEIVNVVGDVFDPPPEQEEGTSIVNARWNVGTLAHAFNLQRHFSNSVNELEWMDVFQPRQVICRWVRFGEIQNELGTFYYPMMGQFAIKDDDETWDREFLQRGYRHFVKDASDPSGYSMIQDPSRPGDTSAKIREIKAIPGGGDAKKLDQDGFLLSDEDPGVFLPYRTRRERDFNLMALPGV